MRTILTKLVAAAASAAAAIAARQAAEAGWRWARGQEPPGREGEGGVRGAIAQGDDTQLRDLMLWSALVTITVLLAKRVASSKTQQLLSRSG